MQGQKNRALENYLKEKKALQVFKPKKKSILSIGLNDICPTRLFWLI